MTCTPYGINTHRLLVRGHRVEDVQAAAASAAVDTAEGSPLDAGVPLGFGRRNSAGSGGRSRDDLAQKKGVAGCAS